MSYTLDEANYLIKYYSDKMVGQYLDAEKLYVIKKLQKDIQPEISKYLVRACGKRDNKGFLLFLEISEIANRLNLDPPQTVLLGINRNP